MPPQPYDGIQTATRDSRGRSGITRADRALDTRTRGCGLHACADRSGTPGSLRRRYGAHTRWDILRRRDAHPGHRRMRWLGPAADTVRQRRWRRARDVVGLTRDRVRDAPKWMKTRSVGGAPAPMPGSWSPCARSPAIGIKRPGTTARLLVSPLLTAGEAGVPSGPLFGKESHN